MSIPTVLVLPFPLQGHVNPMMILSQKLIENGCKVIFVNTEFNHKRMVSSMIKQEDNLYESSLKLVSIPDGLGPDDKREDVKKLVSVLFSTMTTMFEKLIEDIQLNGENRISLIVADLLMAWALDIGNKFGIKRAIYWSGPAGVLASIYSIPKLIQEGIINSDGLVLTTEKKIRLSRDMSEMDTRTFVWLKNDDNIGVRESFKYLEQCAKALHLTEWWLCNTTYELEHKVSTSFPRINPIGPLLRNEDTMNTTTRSLGQFWEEDISCMSWLDEQPHRSITYVAFGSTTRFNQNQFNELVLGLILTNRPFLLVAREDNKLTYPYEFQACKGKVVGWSPQQKVLNHPSIACFFSHCGWNSVMEGLCNGLPFLCWPYFADHFYGETLICHELNVGLGLDSNENGIVSRWEIKNKLDHLVSDENIRYRSLKIKEKIMNKGRSFENIKNLVKWLKE